MTTYSGLRCYSLTVAQRTTSAAGGDIIQDENKSGGLAAARFTYSD